MHILDQALRPQTIILNHRLMTLDMYEDTQSSRRRRIQVLTRS